MSSDSEYVNVKVTKRDLKVAGITTPIAIAGYEIFKKYIWKPGIRRLEEYFERKGIEDRKRTLQLLEEMGYLQKKPEK